MDVQDVIAIIVVLGAAAYAVRFVYRALAGGSGCAHGCGCSAGSDDTKRAGVNRAMQAKRLPLVTLNPIGTPSDNDTNDTSSVP